LAAVKGLLESFGKEASPNDLSTPIRHPRSLSSYLVVA
jgi:hypothetical protein